MNAVHPTSNWTWRDLRLWSVDGFVLPFWGWNSDPFLQIPAYFSTCRIMFWRMTDRTSAVASGNHGSLIVFSDRSIVSTFILHKIYKEKRGSGSSFFFRFLHDVTVVVGIIGWNRSFEAWSGPAKLSFSISSREVLDITFFAHFWPRSLYWILCHIWLYSE